MQSWITSHHYSTSVSFIFSFLCFKLQTGISTLAYLLNIHHCVFFKIWGIWERSCKRQNLIKQLPYLAWDSSCFFLLRKSFHKKKKKYMIWFVLKRLFVFFLLKRGNIKGLLSCCLCNLIPKSRHPTKEKFKTLLLSLTLNEITNCFALGSSSWYGW